MGDIPLVGWKIVAPQIKFITKKDFMVKGDFDVEIVCYFVFNLNRNKWEYVKKADFQSCILLGLGRPNNVR